MNKYYYGITDLPWEFNDRKRNKTKFGGGAHSSYSVVSKKDLQQWPIPELFEEDAMVFSWVTSSHVEECIELFKHWGFRFIKIAFTWVKTTSRYISVEQYNIKSYGIRFNPGTYSSSSEEYVLQFRKGKTTGIFTPKTRPYSTFFHPLIYTLNDKGKKKIWHSRKPFSLHIALDQMYPDASKLEICARPPLYPSSNWDFIGDQIKGQRIQDAVENGLILPAAHQYYTGNPRGVIAFIQQQNALLKEVA